MLVLVLAACGAAERPAFVLAAGLVTPTDVRLSWRGGPDDVAANVVEFASEPTRTEADARARPRGLGAPTNLTATVVARDGVRFEWTDDAATEVGFLLESRPQGAREFRVVAVLGREVTAFGLVTLPDERAARFRVRAYEFGEPSAVAHRTTGIS